MANIRSCDLWRTGTGDSLSQAQQAHLAANDPYTQLLSDSLTSRPTSSVESEPVEFRQNGILVPHLHALQFKFSFGECG